MSSSKSGVLKRVGIGVGALVVLLLIAGGGVFAASSSRMDATHQVEVVPLAVKPSADLVARGKEIATFRGCTDCHGENLAGRIVADAMPVMVLAGSNITPGGVVKDYTDEDWARTIRYGIKPDGKSLKFMPSYEWTKLSHKDLAAIIAYIKSVPAVSEPGPEFQVGPLGRILFLAGELPLLPAELVDKSAQPADPVRGPTAEYGEYLAAGCVGCHGKDLGGGPIPGVPPDWPPAANLTPHETGLGPWKFEDFKNLFRTGKRPDGTELQSQYMPWKFIGEAATDDDLKAMWEFTRSVPAVPTKAK